MTQLKVGDPVAWNSEAGRAGGRIVKVPARDTRCEGHTRHRSRADLKYEIRSDRSEHAAMHKGGALPRID